MDEIVKIVKNWILRAENDLKTASDELKTKSPVTDTICFHAQQCTEKYLKAYLVFHQKRFKKTHDIAKIVELCKEIDTSFEDMYAINADGLTDYAVEIRYGEDFYLPSVNEAKEAVKIAIKVKEFVKKKFFTSGLFNKQ